ncbi:AraC family transcriptional regulator [Clostridium sp.]|uniref:AraC family transcriptional regulator n=1 Tax=Clostridium sp. TaxID=1506 RepID=UPI00262D0E0D|nr:AraC family transcriptional regulator [uncultured Clostridium sp.]
MKTKINIFSYAPKKYEPHVHLHWHKALEILYMIKGSIRVQIDNRSFILSKGNLLIIGSEKIHSTNADSEAEEEILVFHIAPDFIETSFFNIEDKNSIELFVENRIQFPEPIIEKDADIVSIIDCVFNIKQEFENKQEAYSIIIKANIFSLIGTLVRKYSKTKKNQLNNINEIKTKEMLFNTFRLIDEQYMTRLTLEIAAKASNLSVSHFCRLLKKTTGTTFNHYLTAYRVKIAENMFGLGKDCSDAALKCGFESIQRFIRAF